MLTEISPGLYQSKLPFQGNPLRDINVYIIKNQAQALMVDNGIDLAETRQELLKDIRQLDLDLAQTDFFITHGHPDHCSNTPFLAHPESQIYMGQADIEMLNYGSAEMQALHARRDKYMGLPEGDFFQDNSFKAVHPMHDQVVKDGRKISTRADGDIIKCGDYTFTCIETPGHSAGHLCLYEPNKKILLCGDHILQKITSVILPHYENDNPLREYLESLEKVLKLDINLALPAHRSLIPNAKERIKAIQHHHTVRLNEILTILSGNRLNTYQIAARMHWDVPYPNWEDFPLWQRVIATAEADAHLRYLMEKGRVRVDDSAQPAIYSAS
jgi:glyoxylase-like metal-dependent hydrolase (beta-lactamase superfamily II)